MKLRTLAVAASAITLLGVGGLAVTTGRLPVPGLKPRSSTSDMASPRTLTKPKDDNKAVVVIQMCMQPSEPGQKVNIPWALGSEPQLESLNEPLICTIPWGKSATLKRGDRAMVGWQLMGGTVSKFQARITVNNRQAVWYSGPINQYKIECIIGEDRCFI